MSSMLDYMLDEKMLKEGVRLPLFDHAGVLTDDWIQVRSMHSDKFQQAMEAAQKKLRDNPDVDINAVKLNAQVALVSAWSFDEKCNAKSIRKFLIKAPHIATRIDKAAGNTALFFPQAAESSLNGHAQSSHSSDVHQVQIEA